MTRKLLAKVADEFDLMYDYFQPLAELIEDENAYSDADLVWLERNIREEISDECFDEALENLA